MFRQTKAQEMAQDMEMRSHGRRAYGRFCLIAI